MGMYDSVMFNCPSGKCHELLEVQSKAMMAPSLREYSGDEVPLEIAASIEGNQVWCHSCNEVMTVVKAPDMPQTIRMELRR